MEIQQKKKQLWTTTALICAILCLCCKSKKNAENLVHETLYEDHSSLVRKVVYDTGDTKQVLKYYTRDTFANGAEIHYAVTGKIKKWLWFIKGTKYAIFGVYYDNNGNYARKMGQPIFNAVSIDDSTLAIQLANPPNLNCLFSYKESIEEKMLRLLIKEPGKTDSTSWVTIPKPNFEKGHKYYTCFYVLNENKEPIDSTCQELLP
ncbi:MAG: hypothetical protein JST82_13890 [Bacteroidetes bacterium]|nr:hypothetical protein [Bacteroidota bacterium]